MLNILKWNFNKEESTRMFNRQRSILWAAHLPPNPLSAKMNNTSIVLWGESHQLVEHQYCLRSFKTGLGLKLNMEKYGSWKRKTPNRELYSKMRGHARTFITVKKLFSTIVSMIFTSKVTHWGITVNLLNLQLSWGIWLLRKYRNSYLSQITYILV